jgi:hypothetical protein
VRDSTEQTCPLASLGDEAKPMQAAAEVHWTVQPDLNSEMSGLEDGTKLFELVSATKWAVDQSLQTGVERSDFLDE